MKGHCTESLVYATGITCFINFNFFDLNFFKILKTMIIDLCYLFTLILHTSIYSLLSLVKAVDTVS